MKQEMLPMLPSSLKPSTIYTLHLRTLSNVHIPSLFPAIFANIPRAFDKPPFRCENEGWGEFDMTIDLFAVEKGGKHSVSHDLNFAKPRYEAKHVISFKNPNAALLEILRKSGPVPGEDVNGGGRKKADAGEKKRKRTAQVDMDKLAEGLVKLHEDDLLQVVQLIHDNKTEETYTKNDVEGEFH
jgi:transcription initiation factor IIF auxiliary subunit